MNTIDSTYQIEFPGTKLICPWDDVLALSFPNREGYDNAKKRVEAFLLSRWAEVKGTEATMPLFSIGPVEVFADNLHSERILNDGEQDVFFLLEPALEFIQWRIRFYQVDAFGHLL